MSSKLQRLYVKSGLSHGALIALEKDQAHYLGNVLRLKPGDALLLFNGSDGEWCAELSAIGKKGGEARAMHQTRPQDEGPDLHYLFAPLKRARLDYMAQKATELGASALRPPHFLRPAGDAGRYCRRRRSRPCERRTWRLAVRIGCNDRLSVSC